MEELRFRAFANLLRYKAACQRGKLGFLELESLLLSVWCFHTAMYVKQLVVQ